MSELKVSALTNAAKISHLIDETTIGPRSLILTKKSPPPKNASESVTKNDGSKEPKNEASKWRKDVWRSVTADEESADKIEKTRKAQVRQELMQRQAKYDELSVLMNEMRIDSTEKAVNMVKKNLLFKEEQILEAVRRFEENAKQDEEQAQLELIEHNKRMNERTNRLKRAEEVRSYFESIKSFKNLFIMLFEKYVKLILQNQQHLKQFQEYSQQKDQFLARYETLINRVNSGHITIAEVNVLEKICDDLKDAQRAIDDEINRNAEALDKLILERSEAVKQQQQQQQHLQQLAAEQQYQQEEAQKQKEFQNKLNDHVDSAPGGGQAVTLHSFVQPARLMFYNQIMSFYEQYAQSVKPLQSDDNMKKYRFSCQKAVNIPLNAISAVSPSHLQDKFDKLSLLLAGTPVKVGDIQISSADHPLGVRFCTLLVAKRLVGQADSIVSSNPQSAFPIASVIIAIWQKFPDIGNLFLAYLYKECPYLVPYFIPQLEGHGTEEYLKLLGYRYTDGVLEKQDQYLKRMSGMIRLYSSIMITSMRRGQSPPHPHGLDNGWMWITNILNLDPLPDICATLIQEFLLTAGAEMWKVYGKQFHKLLISIHQQYMAKLNKVDEGGPKARLEALLNKILKENRIDSPGGLLAPNFW